MNSYTFPCTRHSLCGNRLGDEGWTAVFKALCENKGDKIESWGLSGQGVGPETAKALAEYASVSSALKSVKCVASPHMHPARCVHCPVTCTFPALVSLFVMAVSRTISSRLWAERRSQRA